VISLESIANINPFGKSRKAEISPGSIANVKEWHRKLRQVYAMRELDETGFAMWAAIIGHCDDDIMQRIIKDWIANNDKAPKPSNLLAEYKYITKPSQTSRGPQIINGEEVYNCRYCHDFGYFRAYDGDVKAHGRLADQVMYPCGCSTKDISSNLFKALHDDMWYWSDELFGFVRKIEWIGDYQHG
jgi:hypothetical protein